MAVQNKNNQCNSSFSRLDLNNVFSFIRRNNQKEKSYKRELPWRLYSLELAYQQKLLKPEDVIFNFSEHKLIEDEKDALGLGLRHCLNPI